MSRTFLAGASIVARDEVLEDASLVLEGEAIVDVVPAGTATAGAGNRRVQLPEGSVIVPGFIDVHVHGVAGVDVLDEDDAIRRVAKTLPRYGVTAFAPTTIACPPDTLSRFLGCVGRAAANPTGGSARVLTAHLESNFISPDFRGAQPLECLCPPAGSTPTFSGADILRVIDEHRSAVGIVTLAPEIEGGIELTGRFAALGIDVSIGHTGATYDQTIAAFAAGAIRATHTFSAMRPFTQRDPGVVGAVLTQAGISAEVICDGVHAHPAAVALAMAAKGRSNFIAITDGTAASGLPRGSRAHLGWRAVTALDAARYEDGSLAGSVATMDQVFRVLTQTCGFDLPTAVRVTSTNPARDRHLDRTGAIAIGYRADLVVLSPDLTVSTTWLNGQQVWPV